MMRSKFLTSAFLFLSFALLSITAFAEKPLSQIQKPKSLQNRERALQYFQDQLDFTTTPYGVKTALDAQDPKVVVLDVRSLEDYKKERIPGSVSLPLTHSKDFLDRKGLLLNLEQGKIYYVYCYHDLCNLSQKVCKDLITLGYRAKEVRGGFEGWKNQGYPVDACSKDCECTD